MAHLTLSSPDEAVADYVDSFIQDFQFYNERARQNVAHDGVELRRESRHILCVPVVVQPTDQSGVAKGERFVAVTRNISHQGIGLMVSADDPKMKFFRVELCTPTSGRSELLVEVRHDDVDGTMRFLGGRFVADN